jgi:DNA-binding transcriptional ArsR family regulator
MAKKIDENKIQAILNSLKKHPEGTYVSEISRETGLSKSTVSYLLTKHLSDKTKEIKSGKGGLFKIFILK